MKIAFFISTLTSLIQCPTRAFQVSINSPSTPNKLRSSRRWNSTRLYSVDMSTPVSNAIAELDTFYQTAPYTAAFMTCGIKASAADFLAQARERKIAMQKCEKTDEQIVLERNLAFILYGGLYQGMAQCYIYNVLFPLWFGTGSDILSVTIKVAFDMLVVSPFLCLPVAYLTKATINGQTLKDGLDKYIYDFQHKNLLATYCKIWLPAQFCTFGLVPEHLRIAFIAFVSFFWLIILSTVSSAKMTEIEPDSRSERV